MLKNNVIDTGKSPPTSTITSTFTNSTTPTTAPTTPTTPTTSTKIDLKNFSKSVDDAKFMKRKSTNSPRFKRLMTKARSVDAIDHNQHTHQRMLSPRSHLLSSPRLQTLSNLLGDSQVTKIKKIGRGLGSGTTIWEVNVSLNEKKPILPAEKLMVFPNSSNFQNWEEKLSHCCMKELSLDFAVQYEIDTFIEEIDKLRKLPENHDNIVQFLGFQVTNEYMRIFTRLYDGTLADILKDRFEKLTVEQVVKLSSQICSALMVIHSRRMMHRDIKSSNVFFTGNPNDMDNLVLVLGDYGESKYIDALNRAKTCVGTNVWMAPEVLTGQSKREYSFAADMYSFGMLMYELMTLNMPYYESKGFAAVSKIMNGEKPKFTAADNGIYDEIMDVWNSLVDSNADSRPTSAKTFCVLTDMLHTLNNDVINL